MARNFNGSSDYINIAAGFDIPALPFTISCWINPSAVSSGSAIIFGSGTIGTAQLYLSGTTFSFALAGVSVLVSVGTAAVGTWYNVVASYDGTTAKISINGATTTNTTTQSLTNGSYRIGTDSTGAGRFFPGVIADVAVWNVALASTDVAKLAAGWRPVDVNSANLQGWWPLGGGSPDPDDSGNNNNGTLTGTVQCDGPNQIRRGARSFNGTSDKILAATVTAAGSWTIACWAQANATSGTQAICYNGNSASNGFGIQSSDGSAHIRGVIGTAGNVTSTTAPPLAWAHYALVNNAGSQTLYLNGGSIGTASITPVAPSGGNASIGVDTSNFFGGDVADVAIWNVALSGGNISSLASGVRPINVNSANLQGWWPLDSFGATENDHSGNANNGTVTGTTSWLGPPYTWRIG